MNQVSQADLIAWYCIRTRYRKESFAAKQLSERTLLPVFAPRLTVKPGKRAAVRLAAEPLFPGYLFCRFSLGADLRHVLSTPDVISIVRFGDRTPAVSDDVVTFLQQQSAITHEIEPVLVPGDWVSVLCGSFSGFEGRVASFDEGKCRAWVLLSILGSEVRVSLPVSTLRSGKTNAAVPQPLLVRGA